MSSPIDLADFHIDAVNNCILNLANIATQNLPDDQKLYIAYRMLCTAVDQKPELIVNTVAQALWEFRKHIIDRNESFFLKEFKLPDVNVGGLELNRDVFDKLKTAICFLRPEEKNQIWDSLRKCIGTIEELLKLIIKYPNVFVGSGILTGYRAWYK